MNFEDFKSQSFRLMDGADHEELRRLLQAHPEYFDVPMRGGRGSYRFIDYLQEYALVQLKDYAVVHKILESVFDYGSDPNGSYYNQTNTGFLTKAAACSLPLARLFVERGARINHDLFGRPACWPLISAAMADKLDIVQYLVEQGAVVNFVNIHGLSPLDYAKPGSAVRECLLSVGAKSGTELPKDHLPKPEDETPPSYDTFEAFLRGVFGEQDPITALPLGEVVPLEPPLRYWRLPEAAVNDASVMVVTDGLSAVTGTVPAGAEDGVPHAELGIEFYESDFPLSDEGFRDRRTRWPWEWLRRLSQHPAETGEAFRRATLVSNGEPPEPLGEGTAFAGWLLRSADDKEWGRWERPNGTAVELLMATPLFADELAFGMENGTTDLISRLQRARFLDRIWPSRRSVVS